nr:hypothetical protein - fruit fly (Drosophila hydei) [Drosophila hydei]
MEKCTVFVAKARLRSYNMSRRLK